MSRLRRAGGVESVQAKTGVPLLRHRITVPDRSRVGKVAERELSGGLLVDAGVERDLQEQRRSVQCQSCKAIMTYDATRVGQNCEFCGSPALVAYDEIKSPFGRKVCCRSGSITVVSAMTFAAGGAANGSLPAGSRRRRWSIPSKASTFRTGRSTRTRTARGMPMPATITTSTWRAATARDAASSARNVECDGKRPPASSTTPLTMTWCPARPVCRRICCDRSSRFRPARSCRTTVPSFRTCRRALPGRAH